MKKLRFICNRCYNRRKYGVYPYSNPHVSPLPQSATHPENARAKMQKTPTRSALPSDVSHEVGALATHLIFSCFTFDPVESEKIPLQYLRNVCFSVICNTCRNPPEFRRLVLARLLVRPHRRNRHTGRHGGSQAVTSA